MESLEHFKIHVRFFGISPVYTTHPPKEYIKGFCCYFIFSQPH